MTCTKYVYQLKGKHISLYQTSHFLCQHLPFPAYKSCLFYKIATVYFIPWSVEHHCPSARCDANRVMGAACFPRSRLAELIHGFLGPSEAVHPMMMTSANGAAHFFLSPLYACNVRFGAGFPGAGLQRVSQEFLCRRHNP